MPHWAVRPEDAEYEEPTGIIAGGSLTSGGVILTDEELERLADEAERGYEPEQLQPRKTVVIVADRVEQGRDFAVKVGIPPRQCHIISLHGNFERRMAGLDLRNKELHFIGSNADQIKRFLRALEVGGYFE